MNEKLDLDAILNRIPDLDREPAKDAPPVPPLRVSPSRGKFTGPTWDRIEPSLQAVLADPETAVPALVDRVKDADDGSDYRVRYLLNTLAVWVGHPDRKREQKSFEKALLEEFDAKRSKPVLSFLVRLLRICGTRRSVDELEELLLDEELCDETAMTLLAINDGIGSAFRSALPRATGRPKLVIVQSLGVLKDGWAERALRKAAVDPDEDVRLTALWALANAGDPDSADLVMKAVDAQGWARIQGIKTCLLLAENLAAEGRRKDARKIYRHLLAACTDPSEQYVRDAAERGLASVA